LIASSGLGINTNVSVIRFVILKRTLDHGSFDARLTLFCAKA